MLLVPTAPTTIGHQAGEEAIMAITLTTVRPVRFHGWVLPKGAQVSVTQVMETGFSPATASATWEGYEYAIGVPLHALGKALREAVASGAIPWMVLGEDGRAHPR